MKPAATDLADGVEDPLPRSRAVSVCVPTVRAATLGSTIAAVRRQTHTNWELLLVAQGGAHDVVEVAEAARAADDRIALVHTAHRGSSHARNAGLEAARYDFVAFTDDDCEPDPRWLEGLLREFESDPEVGLVVGALDPPQRTTRRMWTCPSVEQSDITMQPDPTNRMPPDGTGFASANFAIRSDAAELVGPFDGRLGAGADFPSSEDVDFWIRAATAGVRTRFTTGAPVLHTYGARVGVRAAVRLRLAYASGQGALAAKMVMTGDTGAEWRSAMWEQCVRAPLRRLRLDKLALGLFRLWAFERSFRRCTKKYTVDEAGSLAPCGAEDAATIRRP